MLFVGQNSLKEYDTAENIETEFTQKSLKEVVDRAFASVQIVSRAV